MVGLQWHNLGEVELINFYHKNSYLYTVKSTKNMKKVAILLGIMFCVLVGKSQVIDSTVTSITAVYIQPIKAQYTDSLMSTHLGVRVIADNLSNTATLYWELLMSNGAVSVNGNFTLQGADYAAWCAPSNPVACNIWPFTVVGKAYNFTFIDPRTKK